MWLISYHIPGSSWYHFQCISYVVDHANYFHSWYIPTSAFFSISGVLFPREKHHLVVLVSHTWQFLVYISRHVRSMKNIMWLISYHIPGRSFILYHFLCVSYGTVFSSSKTKPENRVLLLPPCFSRQTSVRFRHKYNIKLQTWPTHCRSAYYRYWGRAALPPITSSTPLLPQRVGI